MSDAPDTKRPRIDDAREPMVLCCSGVVSKLGGEGANKLVNTPQVLVQASISQQL